MNDFPVLVNDMLFLDDIIDTEYKYCYEPNIIGIATKNIDNKRKYYVYNTNERGRLEWTEEKSTFNEALLFARIMYRGMVKAYYRYSKNEMIENIDFLSVFENSLDQIHEVLTQEVFRQLLIKNNVADAYFMMFDDDYEFKADEYGPFGDAIYIFKDNNNVWNVWEDVDLEVFMGYFRGKHTNIKQYTSQEEAYIDAATRRGFNISSEDLIYDENDIQNMLNIVQSAKGFLKVGINGYLPQNTNKLIQKYLLLGLLEKKLLEKNNSDEKVKRKK